MRKFRVQHRKPTFGYFSIFHAYDSNHILPSPPITLIALSQASKHPSVANFVSRNDILLFLLCFSFCCIAR